MVDLDMAQLGRVESPQAPVFIISPQTSWQKTRLRGPCSPVPQGASYRFWPSWKQEKQCISKFVRIENELLHLTSSYILVARQRNAILKLAYASYSFLYH